MTIKSRMGATLLKLAPMGGGAGQQGLTPDNYYLVKLNFGPPILNMELVEALLGAEKVKKLLA